MSLSLTHGRSSKYKSEDKPKPKPKHNQSKDMKQRSAEPWERGVGARKISNPNYTPVIITDKNGVRRKLYKLRDGLK